MGATFPEKLSNLFQNAFVCLIDRVLTMFGRVTFLDVTLHRMDDIYLTVGASSAGDDLSFPRSDVGNLSCRKILLRQNVHGRAGILELFEEIFERLSK